MKKIVPFKKDFIMESNISEIVSISLDHDLKTKNKTVIGNLLISGSYKMNETSVNVEEFKFKIPVNIEMSKFYNIDKMIIDINDFYYEIVDNNKLSVSIEIGLDNIEEIMNPFKEEEIIEKLEVEDTNKETKKESRKDVIDNKENEEYSIYKICIVKENENLESVLAKYNVTREILENYNDLTELKIGDKIIIPEINETNKSNN